MGLLLVCLVTLIGLPCVLVWATLEVVPLLPEPGRKRR